MKLLLPKGGFPPLRIHGEVYRTYKHEMESTLRPIKEALLDIIGGGPAPAGI